jgi:hypothetical protein
VAVNGDGASTPVIRPLLRPGLGAIPTVDTLVDETGRPYVDFFVIMRAEDEVLERYVPPMLTPKPP